MRWIDFKEWIVRFGFGGGVTSQDKPIEDWVGPFYLNILHGNYAFSLSDENFMAKATGALQKITPEVVSGLFDDVDWRSQITAAWFCGIKRWTQYEDVIGTKLLESRACYAGQGYCFALANFADEKSTNYLVTYLDKYLVQLDKYYDQGWALAALMWIDKVRKTDCSSRFLAPNGLWDQFVADKVGWSIERSQKSFESVMKCSMETFMS